MKAWGHRRVATAGLRPSRCINRRHLGLRGLHRHRGQRRCRV